MTTALTLTMKAGITADYQNVLDFGDVHDIVQKNASVAFANGAGASQAQYLWRDTRTLTASATENLDLAAVLIDAFGNALTFATIKGILITAAAGNTNDVVVGGAASNAFLLFGDATDTISVKPGGFFAICNPAANGYPVTAATGDILKIANSSGSTSVTYDIVIFGD